MSHRAYVPTNQTLKSLIKVVAIAANSASRRLIKRVLFPLTNERSYRLFQSLAMAWDIRSGSFHEPELEIIPLAVKRGEVVLDVGANYGVYSYHLSHAVGRSGRVYAFEPVPYTYNTLRTIARILRFRNVRIVPKGCSDRSGRIAFSVPVQTSGAISAGQAHIGLRNDEREGKEQQVRWERTRQVWCEVIALDDFLPVISNLSFIKCDIEGAELLAFRGAVKTIERHLPTVLCEINPWFLDGFGIRLDDLIGFFLEKGYTLYRYDGEHQCLVKITAPEDLVEDNYLFLHPSRSERFASLLG